MVRTPKPQISSRILPTPLCCNLSPPPHTHWPPASHLGTPKPASEGHSNQITPVLLAQSALISTSHNAICLASRTRLVADSGFGNIFPDGEGVYVAFGAGGRTERRKNRSAKDHGWREERNGSRGGGGQRVCLSTRKGLPWVGTLAWAPPPAAGPWSQNGARIPGQRHPVTWDSQKAT